MLSDFPVKLKLELAEDPSKVSPADGDGFNRIKQVIEETFGDVITTPYVVLGATDARKYECVSKHVYRFAPYIIKQDDLSRMHGLNERISIENIKNCTAFYTLLFNKL